ncbi:hypothetical protein L596_021329 [Steinernema carpocapsae]|uniref:Uncharacterized protein n=1 Tax=Steinernema carpocapsae TaxID=34508 RepID=A0A4U5MIE6_STECR|nr:hypothetical protein L596_021329 [Steinernema carpocapsae]
MTCLEVCLLEGKMTKARADVDAMLHKCARSPSSTIEDNSIKGMLDRLSKIVGSRKVRNLKTFYSVPRIEKQGDEVDIRCWEVVFLEDAKNRFKPMNCVFVATEVDKEETAYLEKRGILTESLEETWDSQPGGDCLKDELDMVFIDKCNAVIAEKILRIRWTDKQLKSTIFIYSDFLHGFDEELHALRHLRDHVQVYEDRREHLLELQNGLLVAHQFSDKCPVLPPIPTVFKEAFIPHFLDYEAYPDSYVEMKEFSHVSRNVELIQSHIMQAGFVQDTVLKLENVLNGRQLRRIRIAGLGPFVRAGIDAKQFSGLYRLALILRSRSTLRYPRLPSKNRTSYPLRRLIFSL